jgi:hypothetical protein
MIEKRAKRIAALCCVLLLAFVLCVIFVEAVVVDRNTSVTIGDIVLESDTWTIVSSVFRSNCEGCLLVRVVILLGTFVVAFVVVCVTMLCMFVVTRILVKMIAVFARRFRVTLKSKKTTAAIHKP